MNYEHFNFIIKNAILAPSGHNSQPWVFEKSNNEIKILPDFNRSLPYADVDNHELYISLGCALQNIVISAKKIGYDTEILYPDKNQNYITIYFKFTGVSESNKLFECIPKRQVNKQKYYHHIEDIIVQRLVESEINEISILNFNGYQKFDDIIPLIIEASNIQFEDKNFKNELITWMRFSRSEAKNTGDGIWSATLGLPNLGSILGKFIMKYIVNAKSEAKRLLELLKFTQGILIFVSKYNTPEYWVKTGQVFQNFGLKATMYKISHSHLNQPCEVFSVRQKLAEKLGIPDKFPLLLIRYGLAMPMPFSFRRNLENIVGY